MVKLGEPMDSPLEVAQRLSAEGLQVFPARFRDKIPLVKWRQYQGADSSHMVEKWFKGRHNMNYWVMTGRLSGFVVIDADSEEGDAWWREQLGDEVLDATAASRTSKGTHYWFRVPDDWDPQQKFESWSVHPGKDDKHNISFDVRADDTGVIVPPSIHESGFKYAWLRPLSDALPCPPALVDGTARRASPVATGDAGAGIPGVGGATRSMLSRLLERPPGGEGSGRNDWLARVAGHYAKTYHNMEDLFLAHCEAANRMMGEPLSEDEFKKTVESVWRGEHERNPERAIDSSCGYLASASTKILCQVVIKKGEDRRDFDLAEYADFDLRAKGVMQDEAGRRTYWAEINRKRRGVGDLETIDIILRAEVLGDDRALRKFLAGYACTIVPPDNMWPKSGSPGTRLQRYLESQNPPVVTISPSLGFDRDAIKPDHGGFVTHDGVITSSGVLGLDEVSVRADPRLRAGGTAPHHYGFVDNEEVARTVLREILTFHDESVCSVFGAWWAACLLKPQIEERTSLFPFMAIEAPSESGKTNGFFSMMTQLNGNTRGETQPTKAALRDMAAAHRNGIVWVDDLDDPAYLLELLRAATSGGSLTKMGEDRESVKNTQIVSPIVISGEALGLGTQKALLDRAIILKAPSPTARRSLHNPKRPQWDDILTLRERYPDGLSTLAGWYVQDALGVTEHTLAALREGRTGGSGRASDKVGVLRAGARLLDHLVRQDGAWAGKGLHATRLEAWLTGTHVIDPQGNAVASQENALTLELIPWALRKWKFPDKATAGEGTDLDTPVFIKGWDPESEEEQLIPSNDLVIGFNPAVLSEAWEIAKHGRHEKRTTTEAALRDQAMALGFKSKRVKVSNSGGRLAYYFRIDGEIAQAVLRRAIGR